MSVFVLRGLTGVGASALETALFVRAGGVADFGADARMGAGLLGAVPALVTGKDCSAATVVGGGAVGIAGVVATDVSAVGSALGGGVASLVGWTPLLRPSSAIPASSASTANTPPTIQRLRGDGASDSTSGATVCAPWLVASNA